MGMVERLLVPQWTLCQATRRQLALERGAELTTIGSRIHPPNRLDRLLSSARLSPQFRYGRHRRARIRVGWLLAGKKRCVTSAVDVSRDLVQKSPLFPIPLAITGQWPTTRQSLPRILKPPSRCQQRRNLHSHKPGLIIVLEFTQQGIQARVAFSDRCRPLSDHLREASRHALGVGTRRDLEQTFVLLALESTVNFLMQ